MYGSEWEEMGATTFSTPNNWKLTTDHWSLLTEVTGAEPD